MKYIASILLALALCLPAVASVKQVTNVGATASTILTTGSFCRTVIIQNNGSGNVRLAIDGGTTNGLTDPTATTGYKLASGAYLILNFQPGPGQLQIRAILESATTTTLDIVTDDPKSS